MSKEDIKSLWEAITEIKDNHLAHMSADITEVKTNQKWLMKLTWLVITASVSSFIGTLFMLLFK